MDKTIAIQNLTFESNINYHHQMKIILNQLVKYYYHHQMKIVLNQLVKYIHCINCNGLIDPSILNKINCCSSECLYELMDNKYE